MATYVPPTPFPSTGEAMAFQAQQELLTWEEVRLLWFHREGELITRSRIWQIGRLAEAKLARELADLKEELWATR